MTRDVCTLCLLVEGDKILLGMKKVGFGVGKYNGFGGKVDPGESVEEAARREMFEECGLEITEMDKVGALSFFWPDRNPVRSIEVHVFSVRSYAGKPAESDEMRPEWFALSDIPYSRMWGDDQAWLPLLLAGSKFRGTFHFGKKEDIIYQELAVVPAL